MLARRWKRSKVLNCSGGKSESASPWGLRIISPVQLWLSAVFLVRMEHAAICDYMRLFPDITGALVCDAPITAVFKLWSCSYIGNVCVKHRAGTRYKKRLIPSVEIGVLITEGWILTSSVHLKIKKNLFFYLDTGILSWKGYILFTKKYNWNFFSTLGSKNVNLQKNMIKMWFLLHYLWNPPSNLWNS